MLGRRLWPALTAIALCLLMVSPACATKLAGEFLSTGFGAKALGMGGAFASIADDASAIYWNPAGLVQMDRSQVLLMHSERFGNLVDYNCFSVVRPISEDPDRRTNGGLGLIWLRVSDIKITSHLARPDTDFVDTNANGRWDPGERRLWSPENVRNESDNEVAGYLSYSFRLRADLSFGVNAKLIWKEIADISALGFGLDAGVIYNLSLIHI